MTGRTERLLTAGYGFDCIARVDASLRLMVEDMFGRLWQALPPHHRAIVPPELVVMSSVNGFTHTIYSRPGSSRGIHSLVFDEGLHTDLTSLTHHVVLESPPYLVDVLLLKEFARRLLIEGRRVDAAAVGIFTNELVTQHRGGREATGSEARTLSAMMDGQVLFTLAHEIFHTILKDEAAETFFRESIEIHVRDYLSRLEAIVEREVRRTSADDASDLALAVDALVDVFRLPSRETGESRIRRYVSHLDLMNAMVLRQSLWDEFICDLYASLLTVRVQTSRGIPIELTLAFCVLALENLAVIRFLAREAAEAHERAADLLREATARISMLTGALSAELVWQGRRHHEDRTALAGSVLRTNGLISKAHAVIRDPLMARDWNAFPTALLENPQLRRAAVELSEGEAHLRGLVGFPHPGYR